MSSNRVWAPSNTGTKYHAFMGSIGAKDGNFRAACRVSTQRKKTAHYISRDQIAPWDSVCAPCERAFRAAEDRAEASMMPATEARDLGYVAPVDERTEAAPVAVTPAQATALRTIADNPGKVIAMVRGNRDFLTINGNTENKLRSLEMIRMRDAGTTVTNGKTHALKVWELTEAGAAALGTEPKPAAEARADHSMRPATEADDLGYVAPVDERTETPQPEQCTCECTWKCDRPADEPCTCPCVCGAAPAEAAPVPEQQPALTVGGLTFYAKQTEATTVAAPLVDLSTEDGTLKLANGDELTRRGHWADVWLKDGRTYSVSMKVHRKGSEGASTILVDHVIYWTETAGRSTGPIRVACPDDKPRSVGGRIWRLLLAANIA